MVRHIGGSNLLVRDVHVAWMLRENASAMMSLPFFGH